MDNVNAYVCSLFIMSTNSLNEWGDATKCGARFQEPKEFIFFLDNQGNRKKKTLGQLSSGGGYKDLIGIFLH